MIELNTNSGSDKQNKLLKPLFFRTLRDQFLFCLFSTNLFILPNINSIIKKVSEHRTRKRQHQSHHMQPAFHRSRQKNHAIYCQNNYSEFD